MPPSGPSNPLIPVLAIVLAALVSTPVVATEIDSRHEPIPISYTLVAPEADAEAERARWSIPDELGDYRPRETPRLRFNGRKVKLRVPIG